MKSINNVLHNKTKCALELVQIFIDHTQLQIAALMVRLIHGFDLTLHLCEGIRGWLHEASTGIASSPSVGRGDNSKASHVLMGLPSNVSHESD